jgi:hypothetical protein
MARPKRDTFDGFKQPPMRKKDLYMNTMVIGRCVRFLAAAAPAALVLFAGCDSSMNSNDSSKPAGTNSPGPR